MEGQTLPSNRLRFIESKRKLKVTNVISSPCQKLIAAANDHNQVIFVSDNNVLSGVQIDNLLDFNQSKSQSDIAQINQPTFSHQLTFRPTLITVARYGFSSTVLITGLDQQNIPVLEVFDLDTRASVGILRLNDLVGAEIVDYAWHPNYYESIIALCSNRGHLVVLGINRKDKIVSDVYKNSQYGALTCCWSPKGKNLAIGMVDGSVLRLEPIVGRNSFTLKEVDKSKLTFSHPKLTQDHQLIRLRWVNKTYLLSVHARINNANGPETIYSLITVKPSKPYLYWTNVCFENQISSNYVVHLANLTNSVICATSAAGEVAVIGVLGQNEANTNDLKDWNSLIIDEEGARIELPLDSNNRETYPRGLTLAFVRSSPFQEIVNRPILIFLTSDGLICSYAAIHTEDILKMPEFQPVQVFELNQKQSPVSNQMSPAVNPAPILGGSPGIATGPTFGGGASFAKGPTFGGGASFASGPTFGGGASLTAGPTFGGGASLTGGSTFGGGASFAKGPSFGGGASFVAGPTFGGGVDLAKSPTTDGAANLAKATTFSDLASSTSALSFGGGASFAKNLPFDGGANLAKTLTFNESANLPKSPSFNAAANITKSPVSDGGANLAKSSSFGVEASFTKAPDGAVNLTKSPADGGANITKATTVGGGAISAAQPTFGGVTSNGVRVSASTTPKKDSIREESHDDLNIEDIQKFPTEITNIKKMLDYNEAYSSLLDEVNHIKTKLDELLDIHSTHREVLQAVKEDIDAADLGMLETFYLIEYIKSRSRGNSRKKSLDPITLKRVEEIKLKTQEIEKKIDELNDHVDFAWEDLVRKNNKDRHHSLDMIYMTLATNQKIIQVLKKKIATKQDTILPSQLDRRHRISNLSNIREQDQAKLDKFQEFLALREVVPVRYPAKSARFSNK